MILRKGSISKIGFWVRRMIVSKDIKDRSLQIFLSLLFVFAFLSMFKNAVISVLILSALLIFGLLFTHVNSWLVN